MKTQRRQELQTNVLADWLGQQIGQVRPYSKILLGGVVVIGLVAIAAAYVRNDHAARLSAGWSDFYVASFDQSPDHLRTVAEQHAGTEASLWALLGEADLALASGLNELFTNRESAQKRFRRAQESYEMVEATVTNQPQLLQAAQFGLAQVFESRNKLAEARSYYKKVAANDTGPGKEARRRLDQLNDKEIEDFYEWFAAYEPAPPIPPDEPSGLGIPGIGELPDLNDLPERPNLTVPSLSIPGVTDTKEQADGRESAGTDSEKSGDPSPASEQPDPPSQSTPQSATENESAESKTEPDEGKSDDE